MNVPASPEPLRFTASDWRVLACLLAAWLLAPLLLGTGLEIPLNDDWAYAHVVRTWLETGEFRRPSWTWVPAITHTAWGLLFAGPFGFSFESLRWSSLAAGALGLAGTYTLARRTGAGVGAAALLAAAYAWNPVHLHVAFTFMTDALFCALCIWSLVFLSSAARSGAWPALALGTAFAVAATLSRQTGLALPVAFGIAVVLARPRDPRAWLAGALCAGITFATYLRTEQWLFETGGRWSRLYSVRDAGKFIAQAESGAAFHVVKHGLASLVCLGWFLAPVLVRRVAPLRLRVLASGIGAAAVAFGIWRLGLELPPSYNVIWDLGLGPISIEGREALPHAPAGLWWGITLLGAALGAELVALIGAQAITRWRASLARADLTLLLAFAAIFLTPHLPRAPFFDRYLITLVPALGAWLLATREAEPPVWRRAAACAVLAGFVAFGVIGTHDYLARSDAKWQLLHALRAQGWDERRVVGGIEYNGWYDDFDPKERSPGRRFVWDHEIVLSCAATKDGYEKVDERAFGRWLPPGEERVYVHRRVGP